MPPTNPESTTLSTTLKWPLNDIEEPTISTNRVQALAVVVQHNTTCAYITTNMVNGKHIFKQIPGEKQVRYEVERMGDVICDFKINIPENLPQPLAYSIEIGGNTIYRTESPNFDNMFWYNNPIPLIALQFQDVILVAHYSNTIDLLAQETPVYFEVKYIEYPSNRRVQLAQNPHEIPINDKILHISDGIHQLS